MKPWHAEAWEEAEADLPPRHRGLGHGYQQMLEEIDLRISVSGVRGKSSLARIVEEVLRAKGHSTYAKITGDRPASIVNGVEHPVPRGQHDVRLDETAWEMKRYFPFEACIVENQALSEHTMRAFNRDFVDPHYLLVTNLRLDHQATLGDDLDEIADAFGHSVPRDTVVICGEPRAAVYERFREAAEAAGARCVRATLPESWYVPGVENIGIAQTLFQELGYGGLPRADARSHLAKLRSQFRWRPSSRPGLRWFHGAQVNDVESTAAVLAYLRRHDPAPVTFVAYLRGDRRGRTAAFTDFMRSRSTAGEVEAIVLVGSEAEVVRDHLNGTDVRVTTFPDEPERVDELVDQIHRNTRGQRLMTLANGVPPFPRALAAELEGRRSSTGTPGGENGGRADGDVYDPADRQRPSGVFDRMPHEDHGQAPSFLVVGDHNGGERP